MHRLSPSVQDALSRDARAVKRGTPHPGLSRLLRLAAIFASLAATAWFAFPVFRGSYTEGFEPTVGINANALLAGQTRDVDLLYPFNGRFYLVTRLGIEIVLGAMRALDHLPTLLNFRAVMLVSLVLLVGSVVYILARIYRVHPAFGCLACLLFPPIFESAYFFNDNVLSAGLSTLALAVFWTRLSLPATAAAAALLGFAVATRPDAAFIAPAFAVLLWFEMPDWRTRVAHAVLAAMIVALVPIAIYAAFGLSIFEVLQVAPRAIALWNRPQDLGTGFRHALYGLALPGMIALPLGIVSFCLRRRWREVCLCALVPLLYLAAYGHSLYELRYLLPLAPFIAIALAEGGRVALRSRGVSFAALLTAFAVAFAALFAPPVQSPYWRLSRLGTDNDGPRPTIGRAWSPLIWLQWLDGLNGGIAALNDVIEQDARHGGTSVIVSAHWNPDRLLDLTLIEHGFTPRQDESPEACRTIAEVFTRGDAKVVHVRTHIPFIPGHRESVDWREGGLPCLRAAGLARGTALVLGWRETDFGPPGTRPEDGVTEVYRPSHEAVGRWSDPSLQRPTYLISRAPVSRVVDFLNRPRTPQEDQVAQARFIARTSLLQ